MIRIVIFSLLAATTAALTVSMLMRHDRVTDARRLERFREHCLMTSTAFDIDARDLVSADFDRRAQAADRMIGSVVYHSWQDVTLCATTPPVFAGRDQCWAARDYACLAQLAREASVATKP